VENIFRLQFYVKRILRQQNITNKLERNGCLQNIQTTNWQFIVVVVEAKKNNLRKQVVCDIKHIVIIVRII